MFHNLFVLLGILAVIAGLSLAFFSQRYWFARGWRFAGEFSGRHGALECAPRCSQF